MHGNVKLWRATDFGIDQNTLPTRLYPILFPIDNLRDMITTAKRVMIKEKIDRQKTGQSSTTPFM